MQNKPVIHIQNLWAGYGKDPILENIQLDIYPQDFVGLIGPNGGGKTTLIKVILGLLAPARGTVEIMGLPVEQGRRFVGYVPQFVEFDRAFPISVYEVVRMGLLNKRRLLNPFKPEDHQKIMDALEQVNLAGLAQQPIGELSGGQRQRAYIARALVSQPEILLLDEPTASVDSHTSTTVFELLRELNRRVTILLISHDISAISSYVKTIGCLNRRLAYHAQKQITADMLQSTYQCPVDLIAHGLPHRVLPSHNQEELIHD
ncbi:ABC transporter [Ornatilinea apprima]|uniref:ABC transporter n=1 Tax=Ornatilinea apprima TaxID=1134406 RepID=A0A0P6X3Z0_9CHLR|nr:ABC transporter ATP-binding protein [Ornatilinea apprima]KPL76101.1 ABC transporter [Ornatilinea apprima]